MPFHIADTKRLNVLASLTVTFIARRHDYWCCMQDIIALGRSNTAQNRKAQAAQRAQFLFNTIMFFAGAESQGQSVLGSVNIMTHTAVVPETACKIGVARYSRDKCMARPQFTCKKQLYISRNRIRSVVCVVLNLSNHVRVDDQKDGTECQAIDWIGQHWALPFANISNNTKYWPQIAIESMYNKLSSNELDRKT